MKIAVIGAGVVGVSAAYYLQKQGHAVSVYERLPGAALETSYANAGLLTPSLCDPWNSPGMMWNVLKTLWCKNPPIRLNARVMPSLLSWGMQFIRCSSAQTYIKNFEYNALLANYSLQLLNELTSDFDFSYQTTGTLKIFRDVKSSQQLKKCRAIFNQLNIANEWLDVEALISKEPALSAIKHELLGGVYYPSDAFGDAHQFTKSLVQFLMKHQVDFFYDSKVQLINDGNGVCAIEINQERQAFDCIVLAAGYASSKIVLPLDIHLPIQPIKGYSLTVDCKNWATKPHVPVIDHERHIAITPLGDSIRVAGTAEFAGFDKTINPERIEDLKRLLLTIYPRTSEYINKDSVSHWAGLRATSVDGVPFITGTHYKNLYINTGHGHLGWTLALGSGKILSDMISGHRSVLNIDPYSLARL
jgi:D-amino-acid dehydrogenase